MHMIYVNNCFFPLYPFFDHSDDLSQALGMKYVAAVLWAILFVLSLLLNIPMVLVIVTERRLQTSHFNLVIMWLFVFNLLVAIVSFPIMIYGELYHYIRFPCTLRVSILSTGYVFVHGSVITLTIITFDRYRVLRKDRAELVVNRKKVLCTFGCLSFFIWSLAIICSAIKISFPESRVLPILVSLAALVVGVVHWKIRRKFKSRLSPENEMARQRKKHIDTVVLLLVVSFYTTWLPSLIFGAMRHNHLNDSPQMRATLLWLTKAIFLNPIVDPIVYIRLNGLARSILRRKLKACFKL